MTGRSNSDMRSADHHVSHDKTGLHSEQRHPHRDNRGEMNEMATATCRSLHQWKRDTVAGETTETTELLWFLCFKLDGCTNNKETRLPRELSARHAPSSSQRQNPKVSPSPKHYPFQIRMLRAECCNGSLCYPHVKK